MDGDNERVLCMHFPFYMFPSSIIFFPASHRFFFLLPSFHVFRSTCLPASEQLNHGRYFVRSAVTQQICNLYKNTHAKGEDDDSKLFRPPR